MSWKSSVRCKPHRSPTSNRKNQNDLTLVIGRDARISGSMINSLVTATLQGLATRIVSKQLLLP
jgi:hypothetical protein